MLKDKVAIQGAAPWRIDPRVAAHVDQQLGQVQVESTPSPVAVSPVTDMAEAHRAIKTFRDEYRRSSPEHGEATKHLATDLSDLFDTIPVSVPNQANRPVSAEATPGRKGRVRRAARFVGSVLRRL